MFLSNEFLKFNFIFYFVQQLVILPTLSVNAFLDVDTSDKELFNGKTLRAAFFHVQYIPFNLYQYCNVVDLIHLHSIRHRLLLRRNLMGRFHTMVPVWKS